MEDSIVKKGGGRMLNPFVDWAFKYIFAREETKHITIGFLNTIINCDKKIVSIEFLPNEPVADSEENKRSVFDLICKDEDGNRFLVEMQNSSTKYFDNRLIYYTCRLLDQTGRHDSLWKYDIPKVYTICLMNYISPARSPRLRTEVMLYDMGRREVYSDRINIILFQIPCVKAKSLREATEIYEKMLYLLVAMKKGKMKEDLLMEISKDNSLAEYTKKLFEELAEVTDYASLSEADRIAYDAKLKIARDNASCLEFAMDEGFAKGKAEGAAENSREVAKKMKDDGLDPAMISKYSGLTIEEVEALQTSELGKEDLPVRLPGNWHQRTDTAR